MARETAYWTEFTKEAIKKGLARVIPGYNVIEALSPIPILVYWKKRFEVTSDGKVVKEYWRDYWGLVEYKPGQVLYRRWRPASDWEIEEWRNFPEEKLKELGVFRKGGEFSVQIVEKVVDLPAAIRQLGRHIPAEKIARPRKEFILAGDAQLLADYAGRLDTLLQDFLKSPRPNSQLMERASREFGQISQILERGQTYLRRKASGEIRLAQQGKFWEVTAQTSQVIADLLKERAEDYEIAVKSIEMAEKLRDLMTKIEQRFRSCYNRLGQLGEQLQRLLVSGQTIEPKNLLPIANEAHGIWRYLTENVPRFNPYYSRLQAPEFQRLSRIVLHAEKGKAETVLNDLMEAAAKLEAIAIGEKVSRAELREEKKTLFKNHKGLGAIF